MEPVLPPGIKREQFFALLADLKKSLGTNLYLLIPSGSCLPITTPI